MQRYLTTAIDYVNGSPHIGHAYEKVLADCLVRYWRLNKSKVFFLTGVDQHGQKIQKSAEEQKMPLSSFVEKKTEAFQDLWKLLSVDFDVWAETTNPNHRKCVQEILEFFLEKELLYKKRCSGFYSLRQEQFLSEKDRLKDGTFSDEWGEVVKLEEENWYFRLTNYQDWIRNYLASRRNWIIPSFREKEVLNALENLEDLCISRPKERFSWGIDIPFDSNYIVYVWFDALINYISFAGYSVKEKNKKKFLKNWENVTHIIGKDILIPSHSIYWPIMLHALGFEDEEIPQILVHGWWNISGEKISKSLKNTVDPVELVKSFGVDALRYYLMRDITTGKDSNFDVERLISIYNDELANNLGNLVNRTLNMSLNFVEGKLQRGKQMEEKYLILRNERENLLSEYNVFMEGFSLNKALEAVNRYITLCNQYFEKHRPWELRKKEGNKELISAILFEVAEACSFSGILLSPILPETSEKITSSFSFSLKDVEELSNFCLPENLILPPLSGEVLFPKIEK